MKRRGPRSRLWLGLLLSVRNPFRQQRRQPVPQRASRGCAKAGQIPITQAQCGTRSPKSSNHWLSCLTRRPNAVLFAALGGATAPVAAHGLTVELLLLGDEGAHGFADVFLERNPAGADFAQCR